MPDEVGGGGAEGYLHPWLPVLKVVNIVCETSNRNGPLRHLVLALVMGASTMVMGLLEENAKKP